MRPMATNLMRGAGALPALLFLLAPPPVLTAQARPWPPTGPKWETDPARAFARAQREHKVVLAYDATAD